MAEPGLAVTGHATTERSELLITGSVDSKTSTMTSGRLRHPALPNYLLRPYLRLTEFAAFEEDWDSYGALPISDRAIDSARQLLLRLPRRLGEIGDAGPYALAPLASGGIQLEWRGNRRALEIEIDPGGRLSSLLAEDHETGRTYDERDRLSAPQALDLIFQTIVA